MDSEKSKSGFSQIWVGVTGAAVVFRAAVGPPVGSAALGEARRPGTRQSGSSKHRLRQSRSWLARSWPHRPPPESPDHSSSSAANRSSDHHLVSLLPSLHQSFDASQKICG
ncbi:unnamed protein product [Cuscuta epithymum]|uniref:Uncharacterized protein n=1 Tax=Cuscuta epithymum TaxID=186058 RepID=A0AAV0FD62_9ASTE|nr:unnamed protein product [Cuscuta epithymum]